MHVLTKLSRGALLFSLLIALFAAPSPARAATASELTPLSVRPTASFTWVYDDSGTGAHGDISIWRPDLSGYPGYYSLGDVAMDSYGTAPANTFIVSGPAGLLARPVDYQLVWNDHGSGGTHDGSLWAPVAPQGYTCLGSVAVLGYDKPSTSLIRCVKSAYAVQGAAVKVWDDSGSGASMDAGVWQSDPADAGGLTPSTFVARTSHTDTGGSGLYQVLNESTTDAPPLSGAPVTADTARAFAPRIWLHPNEQFYPANVAYHLANVHEDGGYLVTDQSLGCDSCTNPPFLHGQRPDRQSVSTYAEIVHRTLEGAPTNITDIIYWSFYDYNQGKDVCIGWDSPAGCIGGEQSYGNHVGDWTHIVIRFVANMPSQIYYSQHSWGAQYHYGDKHIRLADWRPDVYAALGDHEEYPDAGAHVYRSLPNGGELADETARGMLWDTASSLVTFSWQQPGTYTGSLAWLNFTGRWGNPESGCLPSPIDECVLDDGPTAPMERSYALPPLSPLQ